MNQEKFDKFWNVLKKQGFEEKRKIDTPKGEIHILEAYFVGAEEMPYPHINTIWLVHHDKAKCARPCRHQITFGMMDQPARIAEAEADAREWLYG